MHVFNISLCKIIQLMSTLLNVCIIFTLLYDMIQLHIYGSDDMTESYPDFSVLCIIFTLLYNMIQLHIYRRDDMTESYPDFPVFYFCII